MEISGTDVPSAEAEAPEASFGYFTPRSLNSQFASLLVLMWGEQLVEGLAWLGFANWRTICTACDAYMVA